MGTKRIGLARVEALIENLKRDLAFGSGTTFIGQRRKTISWTADKTLTTADAGAVVFCEQQSTAIDLELPTAADAGAGWEIDVVVKDTGTAAAHIDFQADSALVFIHLADGGTDSAADTVETKQSINFTANATKNSRCNIVSDGSVYYVTCHTGTTNEIAIADTGV